MDVSDYTVTLLGYTETDPKHTNWYPWNRFLDVFRSLGFQSEWVELRDVCPKGRRIYICWMKPDAEQLIQSGKVRPGDIILQKLTSLGRNDGGVNWTTDPMQFFKEWNWPPYQMFERLCDQGENIYAFGCKTKSEPFPEKHRICTKLKDRISWIPWGSTVFDWDEIQACMPKMLDLPLDVAFVGSIWGKVGRGNIDTFRDYMQPILDGRNCLLAGKGTERGPVTDEEQKSILRSAKLCPIVNAPSWRIESGVQDRFWTVFTSGRFGVVDSEGVFDFFDESEVVCETDPGEYVSKSLYYLENVGKQVPYIVKVQERIRKEYNFYTTWNNILRKVVKDQ